MNEYTNIIRAFDRNARFSAVADSEDNPDDAARAIQLGQASGTPPAVVYGDLENFDKNYKRKLVSELINDSPHLRDYINSSPMAAKVSNDDWATLSNVAGLLRKLGPVSIAEKAVQGFNEKWDKKPWGSWIKPESAQWLYEQRPFGPAALLAYQIGGMAIEVPARVISAGLGGANAAMAESFRQLGFDESEARRAAREFSALIEYQLNQTPTAKLGQATGVPRFAEAVGVARELQRAPLEQHFRQLGEVYQAVQPYIQAGKEPPFGIHPLIDDWKRKQSEIELKNLEELMKESQASTTRERSPEMIEDFVKLRYSNVRIGVNAERVAELYAGKMPRADDNLLGWVPDLEKQMYTALATGGDVEIPLSQWVSKMDPAVAKELRDHTRVRPGSVTKAEAEMQPKAMAAEEPKPLEEVEGQPVKEAGEAAVDVRTQFEKDTEAFLEKNQLPPISDQQMIANMEARIEQIERDRRATRVEGEPYPPNAELFELRNRVLELRGPQVPREVATVRAAAGLPAQYTDAPRLTYHAGRTFDSFWGSATSIGETPLGSALLQVERTPLYKILSDRLIELSGEVPVHVLYNRDFQKLTGKSPSRYFGYYDPKSDAIILPASTLFRADMEVTILHEAVHAATSRALWQNPDARIAVKALMMDVLNKAPELKETYGFLDEHEFLAEAISNKDFQKRLSEILISPELAKSFGMVVSDAFKAIIETIRKILELAEDQVTALEAAIKLTDIVAEVQKAEHVGAEPKAMAKQPELPGITRQEDRRIFETITGWMNKDQYNRYIDKITQRSVEDAAYMQKQAEKIVRKQMTEEWKAEARKMRDVVLADLHLRPDINALEFFRSGKLEGRDTGTRPRINPEFLTPEQQAMFPEKYLRRDGSNPTEVAQMLGFQTFEEMAQVVKALDEQIGKGSLPSLLEKIATQEVERRMLEQHGKLEENILREAQEHVISDTQMDLLHEEVVAAGMKAGSEMSFSKADFQKWAKDRFAELPAEGITVERFLRDANNIANKLKQALLEDNAKDAFKYEQQRLFAIMFAREAQAFERQRERFEKLANRLSKRKVRGMDQEFLNWTHHMLSEAMGAQFVRRDAAEIRQAIARSDYQDFNSFVQYQRNVWGTELYVDEAILTGQTKPIDQMTTAEFLEFKESLDSMDHVGRMTQKYRVAGDLVDFREYVDGVIAKIEQLPIRPRDAQNKLRYYVDSGIVKMEEMLKDLDLREELGPLFNAVARRFSDASHTEFEMTEKLVKRLKDIKSANKKWMRKLNDELPNDFFYDPHYGTLFDMTRERMIKIMLNFGNDGNRQKFVKGWASEANGTPEVFERRLVNWITQHATKADWDYVQSIWDIWKDWRQGYDNLFYELGGVVPKWVEPQPIATRFGTYDGGYFPLFRDRIGVQPLPRLEGLFSGFHENRLPIAQHLKERTGAIYPIDFITSLDLLGTRMLQSIHDISYREALVNVNKLLRDPHLRVAIRKHYGLEYDRLIDPWLDQIANYYRMSEGDTGFMGDVLRRSRIALIHHALGLNFNVLLSPMTGRTNPGDWVRYGLPGTHLFGEGKGLRAEIVGKRDANGNLVGGKSRELAHTFQNMDRDFREQIESLAKGRRWDDWTVKAMKFTFWPTLKVEQYFREVTFYNEYQKAIQRGLDEGSAVAVADSFVRERHGSGAVWTLPEVMRKNEGYKLATIFYGYFNSIYNQQRQMPGMYRRSEYTKLTQQAYMSVLVPLAFSAVLFNQMRESDTWGEYIAKAIALNQLSLIPGVREFGNYWLEGHRTSTPYTTIVERTYQGFNDIRKLVQRKKADKAVKNIANAIGIGAAAAGIPTPVTAQVARTTQGLYDASTGKQRPRNFLEWQRLVRTGEARLKK